MKCSPPGVRLLVSARSHFLFDEYSKMITGAKKFIYFEHQYPFQNFALTYYMCQVRCCLFLCHNGHNHW